MDYSALAEQVRGLGAYKAGVVDLQDVRFDRAFRAMCETNACGNYGKCWMCPPDAGDIDALMNEAQSYQKALVYQTVGKLEDSYDFEGMMEAARLHNELSRALAKWFATLPFAKKLHLGAGGCHMCGVCTKRTNEPCRHPELAMPSLETYGINVSELAASSGMKYINGQNTVTYFGALLFCEALSAGGRQSTVGGNALAKVSVNGTHLEAQMGARPRQPHSAAPCTGNALRRIRPLRQVPRRRPRRAGCALSDAEREHLSPQDISRGVRLACCARVEGDCTVTLEGAAASQIRLAGEMPDFVHDPIFSVCGAAVDIGTTTLASCLYGPDGTLLAQASAPNPQAGWGADVISRIEAALHGSGDALAASVRAGVRALVLEMAASAHISAGKQWTRWSSQGTPRCCTCSRRQARTVFPMPRSPLPACLEKRLRLGSLACPAPMRRYICPAVCPLLWVRTSPRRCWPAASAAQAGHPHAGGDRKRNREIALWHRGAAFLLLHGPPGPPLRGPGFPWGWPERRAQWIASAYRTAHCRPTSLGAARRKGFCGSGVIDALACLLELEQLDETGLLEQDPAPVAPPVCLTQKDVRMVQLAKSAICAGLRTLLRVEGLCGADAAELAVAGGFGSYLDVNSAGRIGLLPEELVPRVRVLGNAALSGAAMLLLNRGFIPHSEALAAGARTVDLSTSAEFMNAYTAVLCFSDAPKGACKKRACPVHCSIYNCILRRAFPGKRVKLPRGPATVLGFALARVPGTALFSRFTMDGSCASVLSKKPRSRSGRRGFLFLLSGGIETCLHKEKNADHRLRRGRSCGRNAGGMVCLWPEGYRRAEGHRRNRRIRRRDHR